MHDLIFYLGLAALCALFFLLGWFAHIAQADTKEERFRKIGRSLIDYYVKKTQVLELTSGQEIGIDHIDVKEALEKVRAYTEGKTLTGGSQKEFAATRKAERKADREALRNKIGKPPRTDYTP